MKTPRRIVLMITLLISSGVPALGAWDGPTSSAKDRNAALAKVAAIHGAAGPFAVIGYRIGQRALVMLATPYGSFDLDVVHRTPLEVQYSCVADGVQAATGASVGKLNLHIQEATVRQMETIVRNKATGQGVVFRITPEAMSRFLNLPHARLEAAGRDVLDLSDDQLFSATKR